MVQSVWRMKADRCSLMPPYKRDQEFDTVASTYEWCWEMSNFKWYSTCESKDVTVWSMWYDMWVAVQWYFAFSSTYYTSNYWPVVGKVIFSCFATLLMQWLCCCGGVAIANSNVVHLTLNLWELVDWLHSAMAPSATKCDTTMAVLAI